MFVDVDGAGCFFRDFNFHWNKNDLPQLSTQNARNQGGQMANKKQDFIDQNLQDLNDDGVDRRGFLKCMAWAGTGNVKSRKEQNNDR